MLRMAFRLHAAIVLSSAAVQVTYIKYMIVVRNDFVLYSQLEKGLRSCHIIPCLNIQ